MNGRLWDQLAALPARQLNLILVGVVLIVAMLAWSVGLRAPLAAYRQHSAILATLAPPVPGAVPAGPSPAPASAPPVAPLVAPKPLELIAAVSRSAIGAGVAVSSAAQGTELTVAGLHLRTIDIAASGSYAGISAWLADIEATQPSVGIDQLDLQPGASPTGREVRLQLTIYDTGTPP